MEYIDWDPALTGAATGCHIGLMERNLSVTGFRLVYILILKDQFCAPPSGRVTFFSGM